jgi:hypothetical protein
MSAGAHSGSEGALAAAMHGGHALLAWLRARSLEEDRDGDAQPFAAVVMELRR